MKRFARLLALLSALCSTQGIVAQITPALPNSASATVWVYTEEMPGNETLIPDDDLERLAVYVLSGLVYGWRFDYTPRDSSRGVAEYLSLEPLGEIDPASAGFSLIHVEEKGVRLYCRAEFAFDEAALNSARLWNSVVFKSAKGRGYGERKDEAAGIFAAYEGAIRAAIHESARAQVKNRPKEVRGEIKFKDEPRVFAASGRFVADADFLINFKEIVEYSVF